MKILLTIFLTSIAVIILMFLLNAASFDGISKNNKIHENKNDKKSKSS